MQRSTLLNNRKTIKDTLARNEITSGRYIPDVQNALGSMVVAWRFDVSNRIDTHDRQSRLRPIFTIHSANLRAFALFLRNNSYTQAAILSEIAAFDRLKMGKARFAVQYLFLSTFFRRRFALEVFAAEGSSTIPSLAAPFLRGRRIFASAGWLEREVWDLFGVYFTENGDLRRLLTDYGFSGHPLRKDFPLSGHVEVVFNDDEGCTSQVGVELAQEFRVFHLGVPTSTLTVK